MAANMYRVGDCVYFETNSTLPYQIRRIEELFKTPAGNVEAKVMCFYRRRDIPQNLVSLADKHQIGGSEEENGGVVAAAKEDLNEKQKHQLRHRELFLSRQVETLPATHIRGKCTITLLNETEYYSSYLSKEDVFFYSLVYDPQNKTLLADRGEIRVGPRFQAEPTPLLQKSESDGRDMSELETLVWNPENPLTDKRIDNFMAIARSVGTFARSLDCSSTVRQPSLHMSAAAASRDITILTAMNLLHKNGYSVTDALADLIPLTGPVLCRDEMEEWSASEANLFEEALDKYGRDFLEIRNDFLPWKSHRSIVEYYYFWKTTDRYVQQKRIKAAEADNKLKQVYIPTYNKPNPAQINDKNDYKPCESCFATSSNQWYGWGPAVLQCRVCSTCWVYWKKYGGLKMPTRLDNNSTPSHSNNGDKQNQGSAPLKPFKCTVQGCNKTDFRSKTLLMHHINSVHGLPVRSGSPCPVMKTRAAFCLITTPLTKASRLVCKNILDIRRSARRPFNAINISFIKQECQHRMPDLMSVQKSLRKKARASLESISIKLGVDSKLEKPALLCHFSGPDAASRVAQQAPAAASKKRSHDGNGEEEPPSKIALMARSSSSIKQMLPKVRGSSMNRLNGSNNKTLSRLRHHSTSAIDNFEDLFFIATETTRRIRKQMNTTELKRCGRKPWRDMPLPQITSSVVVLD